jgi:uncharacterized protein YjiS (DUF1127 family)
MDRLNNVYSARFARRGRLILRHLAGWPARMVAARQAMRQLAGMSDHELRDIGLFRQDLRDATALPLDADPTRLLAARTEERRRAQSRAAGLGGANGPGEPKAGGPRLPHRHPVAAE